MPTKQQSLKDKVGASLDQLAHYVTGRPEVRLIRGAGIEKALGYTRHTPRLCGLSKDEGPFPVRIEYLNELNESVGTEWCTPESVILVLRDFKSLANPVLATRLVGHLRNVGRPEGNQPANWTAIQAELISGGIEGESAISISGYNPSLEDRKTMLELEADGSVYIPRSDWRILPTYIDVLRKARFPVGLSPENYLTQSISLTALTQPS